MKKEWLNTLIENNINNIGIVSTLEKIEINNKTYYKCTGYDLGFIYYKETNRIFISLLNNPGEEHSLIYNNENIIYANFYDFNTLKRLNKNNLDIKLFIEKYNKIKNKIYYLTKDNKTFEETKIYKKEK